MLDSKCNIVHLEHSSFLVETEKNILIFDYFNDTPMVSGGSIEKGILTEDVFKTNKDIYVFATHSHGDHYHPIIFQWKEVNPGIHYILSSDIKEEVEEDYKDICYMKPYETLQLKGINIRTFGSTDKGVSFLINVDGLNIFHAGDLNWWHWKSFTPEQLKAEEEDFKREVDKIVGNPIDMAFVPVDPRLEEFYHLAGVYFAEKLNPKILVPMHFRDHFYICRDFAKYLENSSVEVIDLTHRGQRIHFSKESI